MTDDADYKGRDGSSAEFLDDYIHRHNLTDARSMASSTSPQTVPVTTTSGGQFKTRFNPDCPPHN